MDPFLGMMYPFGGNFAINGYAICQGQLLPISQNTALFSILGTTYGGNGQTTFALPDLRGRAPIGVGQGPGLSNYNLGQVSGAESVTLVTSNMPAHNHGLMVSNTAGTTGVPANNTAFAKGPASGAGPNATLAKTYTTSAVNTALMSPSIGMTGGGQPFSTLSPTLTVTWLIALNGIFPSRN
ncbi:tail fiber protein [Mucilaginibacter sp.]|uniref:phage tail protein n=1 Tax=Mucilaginibacter sp. TaxID=1882438 RepID=UPI0025D97203|nr:tail fiber protein [Mucilaginibacter sp.]